MLQSEHFFYPFRISNKKGFTLKQVPLTVSSTRPPIGGAASPEDIKPIEDEVLILDSSSDTEDTLAEGKSEDEDRRGAAEDTDNLQLEEVEEFEGRAETEPSLQLMIVTRVAAARAAKSRRAWSAAAAGLSTAASFVAWAGGLVWGSMWSCLGSPGAGGLSGLAEDIKL